MTQHAESSICERRPEVAQFELLQLWHARQVLQAVVAELARAAKVQCRDELQLRNLPKQIVRHHSVCKERGDSTVFHRGDERVPLVRRKLSPRPDSVFLWVKGVRVTGRRRAFCRGFRQRRPVRKTGRARDELSRLRNAEGVGSAAGSTNFVNESPHKSAEVFSSRRAPIVPTDALH